MYDKNSFVLQGTISKVETSRVGAKETLLCKALIKVERGDSIQLIPIEAFGDKAAILSEMEGEYAQVEGQLKGREYQEKYYVSVNVWDIFTTPIIANNPKPEPGKDDLPF